VGAVGGRAAWISKFVGRFDLLTVINGMKEGQARPLGQWHPPATADAAWVEAVALRVVQLMRSGKVANDLRLVDAATLACELGVDRSWVYAHRDELGAVRLGSGSKPRLRFDVEVARTALTARQDRASASPAVSAAGLGRRSKRAPRKRPGASGSVLAVRPRQPR
jgi:hypothetical protein